MEKSIQELLEFSIINTNKPAGMTSFDVVEKIKNMFGLRKASHFGTLDPMVTGVLPIALNRACKLTGFFIGHNKEYVGKMKIHKEISEEDLRGEMEKFLGKIMQKPPVRSRVKRVLRERDIKKFELINFDKEKKIAEFHSDVQAGTYIRKLVSDLGEKIGGAHMISLRRVRAGIFLEKDSVSLEEIKRAFEDYKKGNENQLRKILVPAEIIKQIITSVQVKEESVEKLLNGKPLMTSDIVGKFENFEFQVQDSQGRTLKAVSFGNNNNLKSSMINSELISVFCRERFIGIYKKADDGEIIAKPEFVKN